MIDAEEAMTFRVDLRRDLAYPEASVLAVRNSASHRKAHREVLEVLRAERSWPPHVWVSEPKLRRLVGREIGRASCLPISPRSETLPPTEKLIERFWRF